MCIIEKYKFMSSICRYLKNQVFYGKHFNINFYSTFSFLCNSFTLQVHSTQILHAGSLCSEWFMTIKDKCLKMFCYWGLNNLLSWYRKQFRQFPYGFPYWPSHIWHFPLFLTLPDMTLISLRATWWRGAAMIARQ